MVPISEELVLEVVKVVATLRRGDEFECVLKQLRQDRSRLEGIDGGGLAEQAQHSI
jgi:hypothetical protein